MNIGDKIVVLEGEQEGWTGTVLSLDAQTMSVTCRMRRPDGTPVNAPVSHREEFVRRSMPVPRFESQADADNWLIITDNIQRPEYAVGAMVSFRIPDSGTVTDGRVVKFIPARYRGQPGYLPDPIYRVLATGLDGTPFLLDVSVDFIVGLVDLEQDCASG